MSMLCLVTHAEVEDEDSHYSRGNERFIRMWRCGYANEAHLNMQTFWSCEYKLTQLKKKKQKADGVFSKLYSDNII
jgi:hypothetical protein